MQHAAPIKASYEHDSPLCCYKSVLILVKMRYQWRFDEGTAGSLSNYACWEAPQEAASVFCWCDSRIKYHNTTQHSQSSVQHIACIVHCGDVLAKQQETHLLWHCSCGTHLDHHAAASQQLPGQLCTVLAG